MLWSIGRNATIAFGVGLALMLVLFALTFSVTGEMEASAQWVAHTHEVRFHNSELRSSLQDLESGPRGFLLTGQEAFLEPYLSSAKALPIELRTLRELTIDNPSQQLRFQGLEPLIAARVEFAAQLIAAYRSQGPVAATDMLRKGQGRLLSDEIRKRLAEVDGEEAHLVQIRQANSKAVGNRTSLVLILGGLFSVTILAAALFALNREISRQKQLAEDSSRLAAIVEASDDSIISKDLNSIVTSWNKGAERLFGFTASEMVGTSIMRLIPLDRQDEEKYILDKIAHNKNVELFESLRLTKDGRLIDVSIKVSLIKDATGKTIGASKIARDISDQKRTETALRESEERFRSLVLATSQIVWTSDTEGNIVGPFPSWQAYSGQTEAEVQGSGWASALHPDDAARTLDVWKKAIETNSIYDVEYRIRRSDGVYRFFAVRGVPVLNKDGTIREWVGTCTDIHNRKMAETALRNSQQRLKLALEAAQIGDWELDLSTQTATRSLRHDQIFGYTELLPEWSFPIFLKHVYPEDRARIEKEFQESVAAGQGWYMECRIKRADQTDAWIWTRGSIFKDNSGQPTAMLGMVGDITERKRADAEIRALNATLEQRVTERTAQLETSNKELEAFSYSVSHDLRSPLRGVNGYVRMLKEDYADRLDAEGIRLLNVVCSEATRMGQLIDDLLAFSRIGREKMESTNIDMTALVRIEFESQTKAAPESAPRFDLQALPPAQADYSMMRQVFANLIGNAIKFTRHQSSPIIEVGCTNQAGERVYYVKDNGAGFDQQFAHKLFGVFQRLHSTKQFEGTGIGLSLVQRIIQRHGGKVWAEGKLNQGATFYFTLPA